MAMRGQENRIGRRSACGLLGVSLLAVLGGCDWLFGSSSPANSAKVRPGAERQVPFSNALPPAGAGGQHDAAVAPVDETRSAPKIGSVIPDKGGQKAQIEAAAKEAAERDKQAREAREKAAQDAADRKAKAASTDAKGTKPPADEPPTQPSAPPPAPVTAAPVPPPPPAPPADQKS
jgi:hypothetical protein